MKPRFNGVRMDYANDMLMATLLASRPSAPDGQERTDVTQMLAGHAEIQLGDYSKLGLSYVNAHNAQTELEFNEGNPLRGDAVDPAKSHAGQTVGARARRFAGAGRCGGHARRL